MAIGCTINSLNNSLTHSLTASIAQSEGPSSSVALASLATGFLALLIRFPSLLHLLHQAVPHRH